MKKLIFIILLLFGIIGVKAQNYNTAVTVQSLSTAFTRNLPTNCQVTVLDNNFVYILTAAQSSATTMADVITAGEYALIVGKNRQSLTSSASIAMDFKAGSKASFTIGHDATLTISNIPDGEDGIINVTQDAATARTLSVQGGTGYTTEVIFGTNAVIDATLSNQTKVVYERVNAELHISFIYEN